MELKDSVIIPGSRETVWRALNDTDVLRQAIPGCESLEKTEDGGLAATVALKVGPVKARFTGDVSFSDIDAPKGYVIAGEGKGGVAGFAKGRARVDLEEQGPGETLLNYHAKAEVGGKLAQLGARLIDSTAKKLARQFFDDFAKAVAEQPAADAAE